MRLWGNMYAGELVFMLIALPLGAAVTLGNVGLWDPGFWRFGLGHLHIMIIALQAFIS